MLPGRGHSRGHSHQEVCNLATKQQLLKYVIWRLYWQDINIGIINIPADMKINDDYT